jgi:hypothetical protein
VDRELENDEEKTLKEHLALCQTCPQTLAQLRETKELVQTLKRVSAPPKLWNNVRSMTVAKTVVSFRIRFTRAVGTIAASLVAVFGLITLLGYLTPEPITTRESNVYMGSHAYHLMRQPLADRSSWSFVAGESNFELLANDE